MNNLTPESRIEIIKQWIEKNKALLSTSNKAEIVINVAGSDIKGKVTVYPEK